MKSNVLRSATILAFIVTLCSFASVASAGAQPVAKTDDRTIPGPFGRIPVRVYTPEGAAPFPVLVYFHGGGFVTAGINDYDPSCRSLCGAAHCVVVSVANPLAPEHKLAAAQEVGYSATEYVIENADEFAGDSAKVAVGGEGAGGDIAAAVCLMARDRGAKMPIYQLLVYPVLDNDMTTPTDNVEMLPPATIIGDEIDPLHSEGKEYADRLAAAGVSVQYQLNTGVSHDTEQFAADGLNSVFTGN